MLRIIPLLVLICTASQMQAQSSEKEKVVKAYYSGFKTKNWDSVAAQFADGFTFTSPDNDDHIPTEKFKEKCFGTAKFFKKVDYLLMTEKGDKLMLLVQIITVDDKVIHNVDVFSFNKSDKIISIEVFFGAGSKYPGNKN